MLKLRHKIILFTIISAFATIIVYNMKFKQENNFFENNNRGLLISNECVKLMINELTFPYKMKNYGLIYGHNLKFVSHRYSLFINNELTIYGNLKCNDHRKIKIYLCNGLNFLGRSRQAVCDQENMIIFLDVSYYTSNKTFHEKILHHEMFHLIKTKYPKVFAPFEERWKSLNLPNFRYGRGGESMQDEPSSSQIINNLGGFVNEYSKSSLDEDMCEIYSNLIVEGSKFPKLFLDDKIVLRKIQIIQSIAIVINIIDIKNIQHLTRVITNAGDSRRRLWADFVHRAPPDEELTALRRSTETGLPYREPAWVERLGTLLGLDLTARPRKSPNSG